MTGVTGTILRRPHAHKMLSETKDDLRIPFFVTALIDTESGGSPELLLDHLVQFLSDVHRQFPTITFDVNVIDNSITNRWDVV